jgi:hypothetical protein
MDGSGRILSLPGWVISNLMCGGCIVSSVLGVLPAIMSTVSATLGAIWCAIMIAESAPVKRYRDRRNKHG